MARLAYPVVNCRIVSGDNTERDSHGLESPGNRSQDKDLVIEEVTPGSADGGGDMRQEGKEPCRRHQ